MGESVFARCLSSLKDERVTSSKSLKGSSTTKYEGERKEMVEHIRHVDSEKSWRISLPIDCDLCGCG